jgi:hypothetical protein
MKLVHITLVVTLACCGGEVIESSGDSGGHGGSSGGNAGAGGSSGAGGRGGSGAGGSSGVGGNAGAGGSSGGGGGAGTGGAGGSAGFPADGGLVDVVGLDVLGLPSVGSPECNVQLDSGEVICVLCNDDMWHCGDAIMRQCPAGTMHRSACSSAGETCFTSCVSDGDSGSVGDYYYCEPGLFWTIGATISCSL